MIGILRGPVLCLAMGVILQLFEIQLVEAQNRWFLFENEAEVDILFSDIDVQQIQHQNTSGAVQHSRYIQQVEGIEVEGAHILTHRRPDGSVYVNGLFVESISPAFPALSFEEALDRAMEQVPNVLFYWEDAEMEALVKDLEGNEEATFYPANKLVYFDPAYGTLGANYHLAYKIELYYHGWGEHRIYFIDAQNGEVLDVQEGCMEVHAKGQAQTLYSGLREINTDSVALDSFELYDRVRGSGIETRNMQNHTKTDSSVVFSDSDNYWTQDNAATNAHWASGKTYDYFYNEHNRLSFDGKNSKILSYIHYDNNWFNASWNGRFARYGDGNGFPLTSIDVVAHELTHGVTGTSSKLIYRDESGALNESFSDIFGTAVEYFALPDTADWTIGVANFKLRSMANPKLFRHPDTYKGTNWYDGIQDRGGVHTNSGVQNYWFYLLSKGGSGRNDIGSNYRVDSVGIEKAAQIAYHNLVYYLTPSSGYFDARNGSIQAAIDLYGLCSDEVRAVAQAWHAVGVGSLLPEPDFALLSLKSPVSSCTMGKEKIVVDWMYGGSGCDSLIPAGSRIVFNVQINDTVIQEEYLLRDDLHAYDTLSYTFSTIPDFTRRGMYTLNVWMNASGDGIHSNDSINNVLIVHPEYFLPGNSIGFENLRRSLEMPLFYLETRPNSTAEFSIPARNTGVYGLQLSGYLGNSLTELMENAPKDPKDNFETNTDYIAKMCLCIDARAWVSPQIRFDLKQTYSTGYDRFVDEVRPEIISSLRVTANGEQIGNQFHPTTPAEDTFRTYITDLAEFGGTEFQMCFESKHFVGRFTLSNDAVGDNSYLDNIEILPSPPISVSPDLAIRFHPNPGDGNFSFRRYAPEDQLLRVSVSDLYDREVHSEERLLRYGMGEYHFKWTWLRPGVYLIRTELEGEQKEGVQRVVVY